jgi:hypothetical protein
MADFAISCFNGKQSNKRRDLLEDQVGEGTGTAQTAEHFEIEGHKCHKLITKALNVPVRS